MIYRFLVWLSLLFKPKEKIQLKKPLETITNNASILPRVRVNNGVKRKRWTDDNIYVLKGLWNTGVSVKNICIILERTEASIIMQLSRLGYDTQNHKDREAKEQPLYINNDVIEEIIITKEEMSTYVEDNEKISIYKPYMNSPIHLAPINAGARWTVDDDNKIIKLYKDGLSEATIAKNMGRTRYAIECRLKRLSEQ